MLSDIQDERQQDWPLLISKIIVSVLALVSMVWIADNQYIGYQKIG